MMIVEAALAFVFVLGILVLAHELGHFVTAKLLRVRVETFSVGFGPRVVGVRRGETDYRISAIPLGGYVKMTGESPEEESSGDAGSLTSRTRWQRFLVFVMGAVVNILLAVVVMTVFFWRTGRMPEPSTPGLVVRAVAAGSPGAKAGILPGDRILEIEGREVRSLTLYDEVLLAPGKTKSLVFEREGRRIEARVEIGYDPKYRSGEIGLELATEDMNPVASVTPGSPAQRAGLRAGDRIVSIDALRYPLRSELVTRIRESAGRSVTLGVLRGRETIQVEVVPERKEEGGRIGVEFAHEPLGLASAFVESLRFNRDNATLLFVTLKHLVRGDVSPRVMSGPGEIASAARQAFTLGFDALLHFMGVVSLQLGIINLLPIPMLDGGHVFILLVEGVLRRNLSAVLKERVMQVGLVFLLLVTGVVLYFDFIKLTS